jgi:MFS family permease
VPAYAPERARLPERGRLPDAPIEPAGVAEQPGTRKGYRTLLRNPLFRRLWIAQIISQTINNAANYGMVVLVATQTGSVTATGGAIVAFSLPAALFGAPAGVLVDRFEKRSVLLASNILRAIATVGFAIALFIDKNDLVPVYALTFVIALVGQFFAPAEGAAIPLLVDKEELVNALALFNITFTLAQAAGLILVGPLVITLLPTLRLGSLLHQTVELSSKQSLFLLVGALYLVCALLIATIPRARLRNRVRQPRASRAAAQGQQLRGIWASLVESWTFTRRRRPLLAAVLQLSLGSIIVSVIAEIAPKFVQIFFNKPAEFAMLAFIPAGAGLVLGSALIPRVMTAIPNRSTLIRAGVLMLALTMALLATVHWTAKQLDPSGWWLSWTYLGIMLALTFILGLSLNLVGTPAQTTMQELAPDWIKGRVLALQGMLFNAATVPSVFLVGVAADVLGLPTAMVVLAGLILLAGLATVRYAGPPVVEGLRGQVAAPEGAVPSGQLSGRAPSRPR